jgi:hypothetical protein
MPIYYYNDNFKQIHSQFINRFSNLFFEIRGSLKKVYGNLFPNRFFKKRMTIL